MDPGSQRNSLRRTGAIAMLLGILGSPLLASPAPRERKAPPAPAEDDVRETIQVLMIVSMKKALELTPDQELAVVPRIQQMFSQRERFARERRKTMREMQVRVGEESIEDQQFRETVIQLDELERTHREAEAELRQEIDRSLNPRQQAQIRLFVPRFRQQMQRRIDQARRVQELALPPGPPIPPAGPDWDESEDEY